MFELTSTPRNLRTIVSLELQWISVVLRGRISRITSGRCCSGRRTWVGGERMDSLLKCKESGGKKMRHESWDDAFTDRLCLGYERQRQKGLGNPEMSANSIHEVFRLDYGGFSRLRLRPHWSRVINSGWSVLLVYADC